MLSTIRVLMAAILAANPTESAQMRPEKAEVEVAFDGSIKGEEVGG